MFDFLNRGILMDEAGGGDAGGGAAVMDAPVSADGTGGDIAATGDGGEVIDAEFVDPTPEPTAADQMLAVVTPGELPVSGGKLTATGRAAIAALKQLDPKLANTVTAALMRSEYFRGRFPNGKREAEAMHALVQQYGGPTGIADLKSVADQMHAIDRMYADSNPAYLDQITSTPEGAASFANLMPAAMQKFAALEPERFAYTLASHFTKLMEEGRVPTMFSTQAAILNRAGKALAEGKHELAASFLKEIVDNHNEIHAFVESVYSGAEKAPAVAAKDSKQDKQSQDLARRELEVRKREWEQSVVERRASLFNKTYADLTKGRTVAPEQLKLIREWYTMYMTTAIGQWQNNADRFLSNNDKDGYLREQVGFFQSKIPHAVRQSIDRVLSQKPGPKPAAAAVVPGSTAPVPPGLSRIAAMPGAADIDMVRTTRAMLGMNRAVLRSGALVQWG